jgi:hypothetical protein
MGFDRTLTYSLFDQMGRRLEFRMVERRSTSDTFELSMGNLAKGIYFVEISDGVRRGTIRVVKS